MWLAMAVFLVATIAISYLAFKVGYHLGWVERHQTMVLNGTAMKAVEKDLTQRREYHNHSAVSRPREMKKAVWHN